MAPCRFWAGVRPSCRAEEKITATTPRTPEPLIPSADEAGERGQMARVWGGWSMKQLVRRRFAQGRCSRHELRLAAVRVNIPQHGDEEPNRSTAPPAGSARLPAHVWWFAALSATCSPERCRVRRISRAVRSGARDGEVYALRRHLPTRARRCRRAVVGEPGRRWWRPYHGWRFHSGACRHPLVVDDQLRRDAHFAARTRSAAGLVGLVPPTRAEPSRHDLRIRRRGGRPPSWSRDGFRQPHRPRVG